MTGADFFDSISAIRGVVDEKLLIDNPLDTRAHNISAKILRHGLSVSSFALLEKYIEEVFQDFMTTASRTQVPYSDMNERFREFVSVSAAKGLLNRIEFQPKSQQISRFESEISTLARFQETPAQFNAHGFSPRGSNVSHEDIKVALKALGVNDPWRKLTRVTADIGSHRADLRNDYINLFKTRHLSAHNPTGNVATSDLDTNITVTILVASAVSLVLNSLKDVYLAARSIRELRDKSCDPVINVRFLDEEGTGSWAERKRDTGRVIRRYYDFVVATVAVRQRRGGAGVLVRDASGIPVRLI